MFSLFSPEVSRQSAVRDSSGEEWKRCGEEADEADGGQADQPLYSAGLPALLSPHPDGPQGEAARPAFKVSVNF